MLLVLFACQSGPADTTPGATASDDCALGPRQTTWTAFCPGGDDVVGWVNPLIGTQGSGNTNPGPTRPHGMVKLGPDSDVDPGDIDAYEYDAARIEGFSHTHLDGPGGGDYGYSQLLFQPFVGEPSADPDRYSQAFDHATETAELGAYAVTLADSGVHVELAATAHTGLQRYTYPDGTTPRVLFDVGHSRGTSTGGALTLVDDTTVEGHADYDVDPLLTALLAQEPGVTGDTTLYYSVRFSRPIAEHGVGTGGAFDTAVTTADGAELVAWFGFDGGPVEVRVGLSRVSVENARAHREAEADGVTLEQAVDDTQAEWGCLLSRVQVEGGDDDQRTQFYTALYHSFVQPTDYTESDGRFVSGTSGTAAVSTACEGRRYYADDWCMWDTYRTVHPLMTLVEPEVVDDQVASLLLGYQQGGWLDKCSWMATGYSRVMTGNPAVPILADAWVKGYRDNDADLVWEAVAHTGQDDSAQGSLEPFCGYLNLGTPPDYREAGWVPHECDTDQSASMTMEYAYDDWATARLAEVLGRGDDAVAYDARSQNWKNQWDPEVGFMRGRMRDGSWVEPFDPLAGTDFVESNAWIFTFFVPQDPAALAEQLGGEAALADKLDEFFADGYFDPSNEPSFHDPVLYNHVGRASSAEARVYDLLTTRFAATPGGLPGNDDDGATSALYALYALGLYPLAPGDGKYEVTTPLFDEVSLALPPESGGHTFTIEAPHASVDDLYIQAATLDGVALDRTWVTHDEIVAGGTLELALGASPGEWP